MTSQWYVWPVRPEMSVWWVTRSISYWVGERTFAAKVFHSLCLADCGLFWPLKDKIPINVFVLRASPHFCLNVAAWGVNTTVDILKVMVDNLRYVWKKRQLSRQPNIDDLFEFQQFCYFVYGIIIIEPQGISLFNTMTSDVMNTILNKICPLLCDAVGVSWCLSLCTITRLTHLYFIFTILLFIIIIQTYFTTSVTFYSHVFTLVQGKLSRNGKWFLSSV